ncbi:hypothetical protein [Bathymodiolus thermophilus thioautotrophic gill symbiont]|uniref:DUF302 domain-containing protein n=1 Tax=Bathymodiolus thermophilus thioautotrophic gill symbiont TaxID=2360 RepID=A0A8H8XBN9_9GAMM|nr:hypothetical protein [Bathymodiolus thermophilus thioautotrophic gill symbiont]CAB5496427.1 hypothetical protein THERMOS_508 [Bathymodiolus thermophilus thioautotrophic gill symbiont]
MQRFFTLTLFILFSTPIQASSIFVEHTTDNDFASVEEDVVLAIIGQGLVIAHRSDVATMLNRTAKDLTRQAFNMMTSMMPVAPFRNQVVKTTYRHGTVIEFCSVDLSTLTTAADPNNILFCPFSIAIFQLLNEPNRVHVSYLRLSRFADTDNPKSVSALTKVENMLAEIVTEALN